jgi:hypothetical protein
MTKVIFCCQKCGACYQATQELSPDRKSGRFDCEVCKTQVYAWSGRYNFFHWNAFEMPKKSGQRSDGGSPAR